MNFTIPTMIMMVFLSLYTIIDGIFVSRFVGQAALSAINITLPLSTLTWGVAIMFATGGSAIVAKKLGEGKTLEAKQNFTLIVICSTIIGIVLMLIELIFLDPIIKSLGATDTLFSYCKEYISIITFFAPVAILKSLFDYFMVTANNPKLGLINTLIGGFSNMILDYVFIVILKMGIAGAALATVIGMLIPSIIGIIYFLNKKNYLHFEKPVFDAKVLLQSASNGSSEMVTNLSSGVTTLLFNLMMINYLGEDGVAAMTIVLYAQFLLISIYLGFSSGAAPLISYSYGEQNPNELKQLIRYSYGFILVASITTFILSFILAPSIIQIFTGDTGDVYQMTLDGFNLFSISFLTVGINTFASAMFTAFSNGKISVLISTMRTLVLVIIGITILPLFLEVNGIWLTIPFAEIITLFISIFFTLRYRHQYQYA
ncbi:MATE family efflux transporter [Turicibacter sanguinis]|nr:MATE family efflux transporter [Turicibacter sanguinis]MTP47062.1 MATE family efflux transporter [Turicibacter sanguinis]MTP49870.1 MATE family efflux transporter [Turicibacter sanguinis]MTQ07190.1 MATE family efflux transporter [Turicibacter sanguinis]